MWVHDEYQGRNKYLFVQLGKKIFILGKGLRNFHNAQEDVYF